MSRTSAVLDRIRPSTHHVVIDPSPPAQRRRRSWWRDGRVVAGVGLLAGCTLVGALLLGGGDDGVLVWQSTRDLAAGAVPADGDLVAVSVPAGAATAYAAADVFPGEALTRPILAGELLPVIEAAPVVDARWVTLPIEPLHAPADLAAGERVDIWATNDADLSAAPAPTLVLEGVLVTGVTVDSMGIGGEYGVTVEVDPRDTGAVLAAVRSGAIDLVRTPVVAP